MRVGYVHETRSNQSVLHNQSHLGYMQYGIILHSLSIRKYYVLIKFDKMQLSGGSLFVLWSAD